MTSMIYLGPVLTFAAVLILIPLARKLAMKSGFVDQPGGRKQHHKAIPPIGGLVIFPVFMIAAVLLGVDIAQYWALFAGIIILLTMGAIDEVKDLSAWPKFFVQLFVASLVVFSDQARVYHLGDALGFGTVWLSFFSIPFSILAVLLLINAINLMDGLDGLAAGYGVVALFWLMLACGLAGAAEQMILIGPLAGALAGFLVFNIRNPLRRKASVFLGDAGSLSLGLALAYFCITLADYRHEVIPPVSVAWILALPVIDTCAQFYRRMREGRHPFDADRGHFHHHFIHAGIPVGDATPAILSLAFVLGAIGYMGLRMGLPEYALAGIWVLLLVSHIIFSQKPQIYIKLFSNFAEKRLEETPPHVDN